MGSDNAKEKNEIVEYTSGHLGHTSNVQIGDKSVETSDEREENITGNSTVHIYMIEIQDLNVPYWMVMIYRSKLGMLILTI